MALEPLILTVNVEAANNIVTVADATVLTPVNCRPGAAVFIAGLGGFVDELLTTTTFRLSRPFDGATASGLTCEIAPFTAEMASRAALSQQLAAYDARYVLFEAYRRGFYNAFSTSIDLSNPGAGHVGFNSLTPAAATAMVIADTDATGQSQVTRIQRLSRGDEFTLRSVETDAFATYALTVAPTAETGFSKILGLTFIEGAGTFSADDKVTIEVTNIAEGFEFDAQVANIAARAAHDSEAAGYRVLVDDTGAGRAGVYTLVTPGGSPVWVGPAFIDGPKGDQGDKGWSPRHVIVADGARRVLQLAGYVGGAGDAPTANVGDYVGAAGYEADIADGIDIRGTQGLLMGHRAQFSDSTDDENPGAGKFRANHATFGSITKLWINNADLDAIDITGWLDGMDDVTNAVARGYLTWQDQYDPAIKMKFKITGSVTDKTGYRELNVSPVSGALPSDDTIGAFDFSSSGGDGSDGSDGGGLKGISIRAASTTPIDLATDLEDGDSAGGVTLATGNIFGAFGQTDDSENGVYVVQASGAAARHTSFDDWDEIAGGLFPVREGDFAGSTFVNTDAAGGGTIDTNDLTFVEQSGGAEAAIIQQNWMATNTELAEIASTPLLIGMTGGNGVFDGFNALTYVDVAGATDLDTGDAGEIKPTGSVNIAMPALDFNANVTEWLNHNVRFRIAAAELDASGANVRLTLTGVSSGTALAVSGMYIGHKAASGDVYDFDGNQVQVTVSGSGSFSVGVGATVTTDWISFALDSTKDLIVAIHTSSGDIRGSTALSATNFDFWFKAGASEVSTSNVTGYTQSGEYQLGLVSKVEVKEDVGTLDVDSQTINLSEAPTWGRLVAFIDENDAGVNADLVFKLSRDGTAFTTLTMAEISTRHDGSIFIDSGVVDLTGISSGTTAKWNITTANSKLPSILAVAALFGTPL